MVNVETRLICDDDRGISGAAHGWGADGGPAACQLRAVLPPDLLPVPWLLDPAYPVPTADATVLHLFVSSGVCDGVMRPTVQDVTPLVVDDVDTVTITLAVPQTSLYGACLGGGFPAILSLDRPLGTRALLDGSFVPPRPPVVPSVERFHPSPAP